MFSLLKMSQRRVLAVLVMGEAVGESVVAAVLPSKELKGCRSMHHCQKRGS
jgi:hypothetical protein